MQAKYQGEEEIVDQGLWALEDKHLYNYGFFMQIFICAIFSKVIHIMTVDYLRLILKKNIKFSD